MATATKKREVALEDTGLEWIRADTLTIDPEYQRAINQKKVKGIAAGFDPIKFGALYVSDRGDGELVILDGQQRHYAVVYLMEWGDQLVPCAVYRDLTQADEADVFLAYNVVRTKPKAQDLYRAGLVAGEDDALGVSKILEELNLTLGMDPTKPGTITSISSLRQIYKNAGPEVLRRALTVCIQAWGSRVNALAGDVVIAIAALIARHDPDDARLARVLLNDAETPTPSAYVQRARIIKAQLGATGAHSTMLTNVLGGLFAKLYNKGTAKKIAWDPDVTGTSFWKNQDNLSERVQRDKAHTRNETFVTPLLTDQQLAEAYNLRKSGFSPGRAFSVTWTDVAEYFNEANAKVREVGTMNPTIARRAVRRFAERTGRPIYGAIVEQDSDRGGWKSGRRERDAAAKKGAAA